MLYYKSVIFLCLSWQSFGYEAGESLRICGLQEILLDMKIQFLWYII